MCIRDSSGSPQPAGACLFTGGAVPGSKKGTAMQLSLIHISGQVIDVRDPQVHEQQCEGHALGAVFMATDYVTSPFTLKGKLVYGVEMCIRDRFLLGCQKDY